MAHRGSGRLIFACALAAGAALGQARDPAAAELLFREARSALTAGRTEEACAKFAESHRLDPATGTLINWAACEEKIGRLASAWEKWQRALRNLPGHDERRAGVERRANALEARVPRLEIRLAPGVPEGARVLRDGLELGGASLGLALPVDPGEHTVEVRAPGRQPKATKVALAESEKKTLEVDAGEALPVDAPAPTPATPIARPAPNPTPSPRDESTSSGQRTLGFVALGVGAAGIVVGSVAGAFALQKKSEMNDDCEDVAGSLECGAAGLDAADAGGTYATVSTIAFGVGIVGLGVGGWLILTSPDDEKTAALGARALPGGGGLVGFRSAF